MSVWGEEVEGPRCPHQEPLVEPWGTAEAVCSDDLGCLFPVDPMGHRVETGSGRSLLLGPLTHFVHLLLTMLACVSKKS